MMKCITVGEEFGGKDGPVEWSPEQNNFISPNSNHFTRSLSAINMIINTMLQY